MANNGGRQGGAGGNQGMNEHVEFTVKVRAIGNREVWHCKHWMGAIKFSSLDGLQWSIPSDSKSKTSI